MSKNDFNTSVLEARREAWNKYRSFGPADLKALRDDMNARIADIHEAMEGGRLKPSSDAALKEELYTLYGAVRAADDLFIYRREHGNVEIPDFDTMYSEEAETIEPWRRLKGIDQIMACIKYLLIDLKQPFSSPNQLYLKVDELRDTKEGGTYTTLYRNWKQKQAELPGSIPAWIQYLER